MDLAFCPLSKHCIKPSGTQSAAVIQWVDDGERLTEEHVEEDGGDNADWPSLVCALKNGINNMYLKYVLSLVQTYFKKGCQNYLLVCFQAATNFLA